LHNAKDLLDTLKILSFPLETDIPSQQTFLNGHLKIPGNMVVKTAKTLATSRRAFDLVTIVNGELLLSSVDS
jgi:hypothetical protein